MIKLILRSFVGLFLFGSGAMAQTCGSYPYTFTNGTTADATQVNANFNSILTCANTSLAPLAGPNFSGTVSSGVSALTVSTNTTNADNIVFNGNLNMSTGGANFVDIAPHIYPSADFSFTALRLTPTLMPSSNNTAGVGGIVNNVLIGGSGTNSFATITGNTTLLGFRSTYTGTVTTFNAYTANNVSNSSGATLTNQVGYNAAALTGGANNAEIVIGESGGTGNHSDIVLGQTTIPSGVFGIYDVSAQSNYFAGKVGIGTATPAQALEVTGEVKVDTFASAAATAVCENANVLSSCSSSIRYKENVKDAPFGLDEVAKMRPVTFKWKGRDENDLGLIAEEVAKINPLFATYKDGKVEGVKYAQLTAVLVNAIKELKSANDNQASQISRLQMQVSELQRKAGLQTAAYQNSGR